MKDILVQRLGHLQYSALRWRMMLVMALPQVVQLGKALRMTCLSRRYCSAVCSDMVAALRVLRDIFGAWVFFFFFVVYFGIVSKK